MCAASGAKHIPAADQVAVELRQAVQGGDVEQLTRLLVAHPEVASARLVGADGGGGTALHIVTDWPGYFPNGPAIARLLLEAGAEVDARTAGRGGKIEVPGSETPLHWAASSDDVDVAEVLIDAGADIEAPDGSIGTPLDNAIGYACWNVARLLVARGARVDKLWHASALGMLTGSTSCWPGSRRRCRTTSRRRSGTPAQQPSDGPRSAFSQVAPISTGCPSTRTALPLTPPAVRTPAAKTSSPGSRGWAPARRRRTRSGPGRDPGSSTLSSSWTWLP